MKRLISILTVILLLTLFIVPVSAAEEPEHCIYDLAGLLTDEEYWVLEDYAQEISEVQQCAVYFLTVDDYRDYGDGVIFDVARQFFLVNELGMGEDQDGVLLILSMAERDNCLLAHGFGDTALTDYGKDYISEEFLDNFADNDWYGGCMDYLTYTDELLAMARDGVVFDRGSWITKWTPVDLQPDSRCGTVRRYLPDSAGPDEKEGPPANRCHGLFEGRRCEHNPPAGCVQPRHRGKAENRNRQRLLQQFRRALPLL